MTDNSAAELVARARADVAAKAGGNRFLDLLEGKPVQMCSLEAALQTLRFNLSALASADSGARVHCSSVQS